MNRIEFVIDGAENGQRIDKVIAAHLPQMTRSHIQKIIEAGGVTADGRPVDKSCKPKSGAVIALNMPELRVLEAKAEDIALDIRYEDDDLLVVNKPRGMVVHPAAGNLDGTLVNALLHHCDGKLSGINGVIRPGIVHRIDKDTSGLLIIAKNDFAHIGLSEQIKEHSFKREYRAVVCGHLKEPEGTVDAPIGRSEKDRKKMCVTYKNSKNAVTHYSVLEEYKNYSYIKLRLETGRTHQIRVHMAYLGHPVAGDKVYGPKNGVDIGGQCLHAGLIGFIHPRDGRYIEITAELPEYFTEFLDKIK